MPTASVATLVETVQSLYTAFSRGDIPTILAAVHSDVEWRVNVDPQAPGAAAIALFKPRRGREGVAAFFQALATSVEIHSFQPVAFMSGGNEVAVRVLVDATVRSTGRRVRLEAMHGWVFDGAGKVTRFLDFLDTLADAAAYGTVMAAK
jgi:ketosteroid isomerase-like protein